VAERFAELHGASPVATKTFTQRKKSRQVVVISDLLANQRADETLESAHQSVCGGGRHRSGPVNVFKEKLPGQPKYNKILIL